MKKKMVWFGVLAILIAASVFVAMKPERAKTYRFLYLLEESIANPQCPDGHPRLTAFSPKALESLNAAAREGWELVTITGQTAVMGK